MKPNQKITTFLTFDHQAEEAATFYTSVFPDSKIVSINRYGSSEDNPAGTVMSAVFEIEGQQLFALNGGPHFKFSPGISLFVSCETQEEIDRLWAQLSEGGAPGRCGWLDDKFGVSWQIVPANLSQLLQNPDPAKAGRAMQAMMQMNKLDIAALEQAVA